MGGGGLLLIETVYGSANYNTLKGTVHILKNISRAFQQYQILNDCRSHNMGNISIECKTQLL